MNTIKHEGNDYEVLTIDPESIKRITHAMLAGGQIVDAKYLHLEKTVKLSHDDLGKYFRHPFRLIEIELYGIQPLKLLEKVPVEFVGEVDAFDVSERPYTVTLMIPDGLKFSIGAKFRCVEVTK